MAEAAETFSIGTEKRINRSSYKGKNIVKKELIILDKRHCIGICQFLEARFYLTSEFSKSSY